jgi:type IV pilus assembly protein PilB
MDGWNFREGEFYQGKGCKACQERGYSGRLPIFEFLVMSNELRQAVIDGGSESQIRGLSREGGYGGLLGSGVNKLKAGLTTAKEVLNTTFTENIT